MEVLVVVLGTIALFGFAYLTTVLEASNNG